ncbi:MAG: presenilin family intramembrane aspartyl protease [Candidatus Woesearchaeota archaeon]
MKHSLQITLILVAVFFLSQVAGLAVTNKYIAEKVVDAETGEVIEITYSELPFDIQRPQIEESKSYIFIITAIMIGTVLVLLLVKFRSVKVWKTWFFLSVALCLTISFAAFINQILAIVLAVGIAIWKIWKPNFIVHNLSEIFIYGGLAAIFVPIMNLFAIVILLVLISIYDMIAVWQSKHMVKMAQFQTQSRVFAGLSIPYQLPKGKTAKIQMKPHHAPKKGAHVKTEEIKTAILGGGDIGFPLLFAGVLMKSVGFLKVLVIPIVVSVGLFLLLYFAKKDRFYPAMPFLSAACFVGYGVLLLI